MNNLKTRSVTELLSSIPDGFQHALLVGTAGALDKMGMMDYASISVSFVPPAKTQKLTILNNESDAILRVYDVTGYPRSYDHYDAILWAYVVGDDVVCEWVRNSSGLWMSEQCILDTNKDWEPLARKPVRKIVELFSHIYDGLKVKDLVAVLIDDDAAQSLGVKCLVHQNWPAKPSARIVFVRNTDGRFPPKVAFTTNALFKISCTPAGVVCVAMRISHANHTPEYSSGHDVLISHVDQNRMNQLLRTAIAASVSVAFNHTKPPVFRVPLNSILDGANSSLVAVDEAGYVYLESKYGFSRKLEKGLYELCFEDNTAPDATGPQRFVHVLHDRESPLDVVLDRLNKTPHDELRQYRQIFYIKAHGSVLRTQHISYKSSTQLPAFELVTESNPLEVDFPKK